ncbi:MAG: hypothetical protein US81_C0029G0005 [Parcubacteria group bacterium GW2011_GWE2_38_18]|nr:MAG: hypothetical protein US81_C0029G0005 [Parcubacteria group bacterium GW2011_GWE2_38_18]
MDFHITPGKDIERRLKAYERELLTIKRKLGNAQVPHGKKEKLIFRRNDLLNVHIPKTRLIAAANTLP